MSSSVTDFKRTTVKGLSWSLVASIIKQVLNFAVGVILARLLSPSEFGLLGMVLVFTSFINIFLGQGLGAAIIQKRDVGDRHLDSIFWLNLALGILCTSLLILAAPWIAAFYHQPVLRPLTMLLSVTFFIGAVNVVQSALLSRSIDFRKIAIIDTIAVAFSGVLGIVLALKGHGVWSLAWQTIALAAFTSTLTWVMTPWRPRFRFDFSAIREVLSYALHLLGSTILWFFSRNFDNLLIGRYLSTHALGIYSKAYQLMLLPLNQVSWVVARVMFPALSAIQHDIDKVQRVYLQATRAIALITFPLMIGLIVVSKPFVLCIFGEKWSGMIVLLQILSWQGMMQSINTSFGWIYNSQGRTEIQFKWGAVTTIITTASFVIGLQWGVVGVAMCYTLSGLLVFYPDWAIAGGIIKLRVSDMLKNLSGPFYASLVMGVLVQLLGGVLPSGWPAWKYLVVQVPAGFIVYFLLVHFFNVRPYQEIRELLAGRFFGAMREEGPSPENGRPVIAHLHSVFFLRSETFIYSVISRHERVVPLCIAWRFENLNEFAFPAERRFASSSQSFAIKLIRSATGIHYNKERFLKKNRAQLLHAHFGPNGFAALNLKRRLRLPLVTTFYGYDVSEYARQPKWAARYKLLFQQGELFLAEGECMKSKLERLGCPAEKIRIQKICIPISSIAFCPREPKKPGEEIVLIFSGRFVEKKGLLHALDAVRRIREKRSDFEFRLIGDGPLRPVIEEFIDRHSMRSYVKVLGFLSYSGYMAEMENADILVHPSIVASNGDDEGGAPVTLLEAQAMGMPIVSTYHADIPNVVVENESALLSQEGDAAALAANIEILLCDQDRWKSMGKAGRKYVETHHDLTAGVKRLEDIYFDLLGRSTHGR